MMDRKPLDFARSAIERFLIKLFSKSLPPEAGSYTFKFLPFFCCSPLVFHFSIKKRISAPG
jgi:hypothetical protein